MDLASIPTSVSSLVRLRPFRVLVTVSLTLALMSLAGLGYTVFALFSKVSGVLLGVLGIIVILTPAALILWAARRRWLTWPVLAAGVFFTGAALGWLAWDDSVVRRPLTVRDISPFFDGAEESYAVLMEYGKNNPGADSQAFTARQNIYFKTGSPRDAEKWIEFITSNRAVIEAEWVAAAPQRTWLDRLNAFDRLGDLTPGDFSADIPRFDVWRFLSQRTCAIASLQALGGEGDAAMVTLLPLLEVSRKLEASSRTLVRLMIARVVQKMCYQTAGFILDRGSPGPVARGRLLAALQGGDPPAGARRLVLMEYAVFRTALVEASLTDAMDSVDWTASSRLPRAFNLATPFLFNPRATTNLYGDEVHALADLAEKRDIEGLAARQKNLVHTPQGIRAIKNLGGRLLLNLSIPAYEKIVRNYWESEDLRLALLIRLKP
jgi:hypothetical protein